MKRLMVLSVLCAVLAASGCSGGGASSDSAPPPEARETASSTTTPTPTQTLTPTPTPTPTAASTTGAVTEIVDGDTIRVDGDSVRIIGIDTPENGSCGYAEATTAMSSLVSGKTVTLTAVAAKDDVDQYGRLLRYVDVDGVDAGLRMIEQGFAIARYDSRDGYGAHPREAAYIAADAAQPQYECLAPAPAAPVPAAPPAAPAGNCDPSYPGICMPPYPPDLDCGDVPFRRFVVVAPDPHGFDGDHDGVGCESG